MAAKTHIAWTDSTWSPILGCSPESWACTFCYAKRDVWRMAHHPNPRIAGPRQGLVEKTPAGSLRWTGKVALLLDQMAIPYHWKKPRRIFVANQADLFHPDVPNHFIRQVFEVMARCQRHTFQVLTKRPARMAALLPDLHAAGVHRVPALGGKTDELPWPLPNVWLGTTVEDQGAADERTPHLLATPAALRYLSAEPLLGAVDLSRWFGGPGSPVDTENPGPTVAPRTVGGGHARREPPGSVAGNVAEPQLDPAGAAGARTRPSISWVIAGGESGPGARPCDVAWIRSLIEQCRAAGVPAFVKQLGAVWARAPRTNEAYLLGGGNRKGADPEEWPPDLRVREFPEEPCPF